MHKSLISIIMPVYNVEAYLEKSINSIINQCISNWELVVIDDGSKDMSGVICDRFAELDNRISVIHTNNCGVSSARNTGLQHVHGEYVIFIDADDWIESEMLMKLLESIENNQSDMSCCDSYSVVQTKDGNLVRNQSYKWGNLKSEKTVIGKDIYYSVFFQSGTLWNKLFRYEVISGLYFNTEMSYGEDSDYLLRALERMTKITLIPYCGYNYFVNRSGNVKSASIDNRAIELLENTKVLYKTLHDESVGWVGVYRIVTTINQVLNKFSSLSNDVYNDYDLYFLSCKALAHFPCFRDRFIFFINTSVSFRQKIRYLVFLVSPKLFIRIRIKKL